MDPLESLAVLTVPHFPPYEHWMLLTLDRKEKDVALRISDALRRHRFYTTLPLGGRVLNLRWTLEAPAESLTQTALLHRQELMNRYPDYVQLSQEAQQLRAEIWPPCRRSPTTAISSSGRRTCRRVWSRSGNSRNASSGRIGLGRERGEFVFPPATDVAVVQQQLQPRQRVLVFVATTKATYAFMLGKETYSAWQLEKPRPRSRRTS